MRSLLRRVLARRGEGGFTLVELMMAITLMGIVMVPIGASFFVAFRSMDQTLNRRRSSNDAQLLSIYLPPDVQNSDDAILTGFTSSTCTGVTASSIKLQLVASVNDGDYIDSTDFNVVYFTRQTGSGSSIRYEFVRKTCTGTSTTNVVGRNLESLSTVTVTRTPTSAASALERVNVRITEADTPTDSTQSVFNVTASRRTT